MKLHAREIFSIGLKIFYAFKVRNVFETVQSRGHIGVLFGNVEYQSVDCLYIEYFRLEYSPLDDDQSQVDP